MQQYTQHYKGKRAQQQDPIPGRAEAMTKTSDGAYAFKVDDRQRLDRFLVLGSDSPTYYASARELTRENAKVVERLLEADGPGTVERIAEVSEAGRAPNNDPALFALAMAVTLGKERTRTAAYAALPRVARIGTHLFHFVAYAEGLGKGWGRGMRRAVGSWFNDKELDRLVYQCVKYRQRDGWSMRDLLRLSHPNPKEALKWPKGGDTHDIESAIADRDLKTEDRNALYRYLTHEELGDALSQRVYAAHDLGRTTDVKLACRLIREHDLPRECVNTALLNKPEVWEALLEKMPLGAMVRNLGKMTAVGLLKSMSVEIEFVCGHLATGEALRRSRLHPIAVLKALKTYQQGHGDRGKLAWSPVSRIVDALDAAFYKSFANVEPTGKRTGLFLDVSASMTWPQHRIANLNMTAREASVAMALVTANAEENWGIWAFSSRNSYMPWGYGRQVPHGIELTTVSPRQRLDDAIRAVERMPAGATDISLPMVAALEQKLEIDTFVIYTDNETNAYARPHPSIALQEYRQKTGIAAKLIVVAMAANDISVADPDDPGSMDVAGFDAAAPQVMVDFARD
jgi:60 kDa SS-A/Ro ribonucleoprotein